MAKFNKILLFSYLRFLDSLAIRKHHNIEKKTILLIRFDAIGDYILFRNYLPYIKKSKKYRDYKLTLCGNTLWKELALTLDKNWVDDFLWIERSRFVRDIPYRLKILRMVSKKGYEIAIQPGFFKDYFYADALLRAVNADKKIGNMGDKINRKLWRKIISDRYYTDMIDTPPTVLFEFSRNRKFFERLLEMEINDVRLVLDATGLPRGNWIFGKYAILFPGARQEFRRWKPTHFAEIADFLSSQYGLDVLVAGSNDDKVLADDIKRNTKQTNIFDMTGQTTLTELAKILSEAEILVANETGVVHMAAAVGTKTICISNGFNIGLFHPYPREITEKIHHIYPTEIMEQLSDHEYLCEKYRYYPGFSINSIPVQRVKEVIDKILQEPLISLLCNISCQSVLPL